MSIELLIENYGLLAIFLCADIECETAAFLGGVVAHRGLLSYSAAASAAVAGSFVGDQFWFFAGRYAARWSFVRRLMEKPALARATQLLEKYPTGFILAFRFLVGLRTISPVVIGTTRIPTGKFVVLNAVAALAWGQLFTALGYLFGHGIQQLLGHLPLHRHLLIAAGAAAVIAAAAFAFRKMRPSAGHS